MLVKKKVPGLAHDAPNPDKMAKRCVQEVADKFIANGKVETPHFIASKLYFWQTIWPGKMVNLRRWQLYCQQKA